jgi:hypothetical protein
VRSISVSYTKQNAGAELDWRPDKRWNIGGGYGYERYDWTRADAAATNENQGKLFVDYKPWLWVTSRLTAQFADRQSENYDYRGNVGTFQWADPTCQNAQCGSQYSAAYRQFYLDNRQRTILKYSVAIDLLRGLTVTPTIGYQNDDYRIGAQEAGLTRSTGARAGVEVAYAFDPYTTFLFSYMAEEYRQNLKYTNVTPPLMSTANVYHADVHDTVHTFMGAANWAAIPNKLDLRLTYTLSLSKDSQPQYTDGGVSPTFQYPDVIGQWQRFEATAKYTFDKGWVRSFGINGEAFAKLRYAWERNSVNNVDQDLITPYILSTAGIAGLQRMTWMAYDNPNYNVHLLGASFGVRW